MSGNHEIRWIREIVNSGGGGSVIINYGPGPACGISWMPVDASTTQVVLTSRWYLCPPPGRVRQWWSRTPLQNSSFPGSIEFHEFRTSLTYPLPISVPFEGFMKFHEIGRNFSVSGARGRKYHLSGTIIIISPHMKTSSKTSPYFSHTRTTKSWEPRET